MRAVTRRGALSLILPAGAALVPVCGAVAGQSKTDAALASLSTEFDAAYAEWLVAWERDASLSQEVLAEFASKHGSIDANTDAFRALCDERGATAANSENGSVCERIWAVADAILQIEPAGIVGLAEWGRAMRWRELHAGVWERGEEPATEAEATLFELLKAIHGVAGAA